MAAREPCVPGSHRHLGGALPRAGRDGTRVGAARGGPSALLTDLYELTMLAGYFEQGMYRLPATFDLFFRELPFEGGYAVMAGLDPALDFLESLRFREDDLDYIESIGLFRGPFIAYLS